MPPVPRMRIHFTRCRLQAAQSSGAAFVVVGQRDQIAPVAVGLHHIIGQRQEVAPVPFEGFGFGKGFEFLRVDQLKAIELAALAVRIALSESGLKPALSTRKSTM